MIFCASKFVRKISRKPLILHTKINQEINKFVGNESGNGLSDPFPAKDFHQILLLYDSIICKYILLYNLLSTGTFPSVLKSTIVNSLLKTPNLDVEQMSQKK